MSRTTLAICLLALTAAAAHAAPPPAPGHHFDDRVGLISRDEAAAFTRTLEAFEKRTGIQFVVTILPELEGDLEDTVNRIYESWRIGDRETERGVLLAVFPRDKRSRLEVGYGLEGELTDLKSGRILREMQELPADPAAQRFALVMIRVAEAVAPDDPLAAGEFAEGYTYSSRRGRTRGLPGIIFWIILILALTGGRAGRNRWLGPLIIASSLSGGGRRGGG
ncbi:TPM domain-containing protein, partial [bacterium]|nr:TPM domain-containing protein [bacterium]